MRLPRRQGSLKPWDPMGCMAVFHSRPLGIVSGLQLELLFALVTRPEQTSASSSSFKQLCNESGHGEHARREQNPPLSTFTFPLLFLFSSALCLPGALSLPLPSLSMQMSAPFPPKMGQRGAPPCTPSFLLPTSFLPCPFLGSLWSFRGAQCTAQPWAGFPGERLFIASLPKQFDSSLETPGCLSPLQTLVIRWVQYCTFQAEIYLYSAKWLRGQREHDDFSGRKEGRKKGPNSAALAVGRAPSMVCNMGSRTKAEMSK